MVFFHKIAESVFNYLSILKSAFKGEHMGKIQTLKPAQLTHADAGETGHFYFQLHDAYNHLTGKMFEIQKEIELIETSEKNLGELKQLLKHCEQRLQNITGDKLSYTAIQESNLGELEEEIHQLARALYTCHDAFLRIDKEHWTMKKEERKVED